MLNDAIFRQAKTAAALRGQALGQFVEEGLRRLLQERKPGLTASSWVEKLPKVPAKTARELQDTIAAADFRAVDQGMWE